jgi:Transcription factor WhiB
VSAAAARHRLCRSGLHDPNLWYPDAPNAEKKSAEPIKTCYTCPVMVQCRAWALTKHEIYGVWGGLSQDNREAIWKVAPPSAVTCVRPGERGCPLADTQNGEPPKRLPAC